MLEGTILFNLSSLLYELFSPYIQFFSFICLWWAMLTTYTLSNMRTLFMRRWYLVPESMGNSLLFHHFDLIIPTYYVFFLFFFFKTMYNSPPLSSPKQHHSSPSLLAADHSRNILSCLEEFQSIKSSINFTSTIYAARNGLRFKLCFP